MTVVDLLVTLRRYWIVIFAASIIGAVIGFAIASTEDPRYRSTASVMVTSGLANSGAELVQGSTYIEKLVGSYARLARSEIVLQPVIEELGLDTTPRELAGAISATSTLNTVIIDIDAVWSDPEGAQELAGAVAAKLIAAVEEISPVDAESRPTVQMHVIESASLPHNPFSPNKRLAAITGALLGLALAVGYAILRRLLADTVTSASALTPVTDLPVLGEVPEARRSIQTVAAVLEDPSGVDAEAFRALATNLNFIAVDSGIRVIVVSSASSGEGKTTTSLALALALTEGERRTLLIDADLRNPTAGHIAGIETSVGVTSVLIGDQRLEDAVVEWGSTGLDILPSGLHAPNPAQLIRSDAMSALIEDARGRYDVVVIDSAPLLSVTDALWLGHLADGVLLATTYRRTRIRSLQRALVALSDARTTVLGLVINRVPRRTRPTYGQRKAPAAVVLPEAASSATT